MTLLRLEALLREQGGLMASLLPNELATTKPATTEPATTKPAPAEPATGESDPAEPRAPEPAPANGHGPAQLAASGPRVGDCAAEYELLIEAIYEGYLLHYGPARLLRPPEADLGLLAGDQLYALGLARLVAMGDLVAVGELADVITLSALAQGAGESELAEAIWEAGAQAVGWGPSAEHEQAKALARAGAPEALKAMRSLSNRYS